MTVFFSRKRRRVSTLLSTIRSIIAPTLVLLVAWVAPSPSNAQCPQTVPGNCPISGPLPAGRYELTSAQGGELTFGGTFGLEVDILTDPFTIEPVFFPDWYTISGQLTRSMVGGAAANFIEVACDGSITGQGHDRFVGTEVYSHSPYVCQPSDDPDWLPFLPDDTYDIEFERSYTISGQVTENDTVELTYEFTNVLFGVVEQAYHPSNLSCFAYPLFVSPLSPVNPPRTSAQVTLSGTLDATTGTWQVTESPNGEEPWMEWFFGAPPFSSQGAIGYTFAFSGGPEITNARLIEPANYLLAVPAQTEIEATIDWRGEPPGEVRFTYGGVSETVPGAATVRWPFAAEDPADTIEIVAIRNGEESSPWIQAVPTVAVPGWAGSTGDWSASSGIRYSTMLNWPEVPGAIQTLADIPILNGPWGLQAGSSVLGLTANSDGSSGSDLLAGDLGVRFAGKDFPFPIRGSSSTRLSCDALAMTGQAQFPGVEEDISDTIGLVDLVPGLEAAACGASQILCNAVRSLSFIELKASAGLNGAGDFAGPAGASDIDWTAGAIEGQAGAEARLNLFPRVLRKIVNVGVGARGEACLTLDVAPDIAISRLGGRLEASATAKIFSKGVEATAPFQAGDACSTRSPTRTVESLDDHRFTVPGDGQPEVAFNPDVLAATRAAAVWRSLPASGDRPGGSISMRSYDGQAWSNEIQITDDAAADLSPVVAFDRNGDVLVVYLRNADPAAIPADLTGTAAFANGLELVYAIIDPLDGSIIDSGSLTSNSMADVGNSLHLDQEGNVHLFWQRNEGIHFLGSAAAPAQILTRAWDGNAWSTETLVVDNLVGHFGWTAAVRDDTTATLTIVQDMDGDLSTSADRELMMFEQLGGAWGPPTAVTSDSVEDHSPIATYTPDGERTLLWVRGDQVLALQGDVQNLAEPVTAADDVIGFDFGEAVLSADTGIELLWPDVTELRALQRDADAWRTDETLLQPPGNRAVAPLAVQRSACGERMRAQVERDLLSDGTLGSTATVRAVNASGPVDCVFNDGFEESDNGVN